MRSCFRFDQNTKRVSRLFYCANICLLEHNSTTNHNASITPTYPQEVVITYTIVCSSRQAASNPIGLNLHLYAVVDLGSSGMSRPKKQLFKNQCMSGRWQGADFFGFSAKFQADNVITQNTISLYYLETALAIFHQSCLIIAKIFNDKHIQKSNFQGKHDLFHK